MASHQSSDQHDEEEVPLAVVMVPLPGQGHLNQVLHLSRLISAHNIPVHFIGTTIHNRQAKIRVHVWDPLSIPTIHFHEFPIPTFSNPLPDPNNTNKFPTHLFPSLLSSMHLRQPVYELVQKLSATAGRVVVIYDSVMAHVVQDIYSIPNAESYCFQGISAFSVLSIYWEAAGKPALPTEAEILKEVPSILDGNFPPEYAELSKLQMEARKFNSGDLFNTPRVIEDLYVNLLAKEKTTGTEKIWAIGPLNPIVLSEKKQPDRREKCFEWLDKQGLNSVIFVSFGTTCSLSDDQISEIALGLERCEQKFIWALREADKGNIFEGEIRRAPLPEGYQERVEGRGLILRDWAPQLEILGHPSTGGFITHCGWNSCVESISMGVPIAAWPMHSDQPKNAFLMTKVLKIGVEIQDWAHRDEVVSSDTIEKAVRRLMASEEGDEIRKTAAEIGDAVRKSVMKGGATSIEMDSFIAHITR